MGQGFISNAKPTTNPALRGSVMQAQKAIGAPQYAARGQNIAAQKFVDSAAKAAMKGPKKTERGAAYPKGSKI